MFFFLSLLCRLKIFSFCYSLNRRVASTIRSLAKVFACISSKIFYYVSVRLINFQRLSLLLFRSECLRKILGVLNVLRGSYNFVRFRIMRCTVTGNVIETCNSNVICS